MVLTYRHSQPAAWQIKNSIRMRRKLEANKRPVFKCIQLQVTLLPRAFTAPAQLLAALRYDAKGLKRALFCSAWTPAFRSLRCSRSKTAILLSRESCTCSGPAACLKASRKQHFQALEGSKTCFDARLEHAATSVKCRSHM